MNHTNLKRNKFGSFIIPENISKIKTKESINDIFNLIYEECFSLILITKKEKFLSKIEFESEEIIKVNYPSTEYIENLIEKAKKEILNKYDKEYSILKNKYDYYQKYPEKFSVLKNFKKHCGYSDDKAYHPCNSISYNELIEINIDNNILYVICKNCKQCYRSNFIKMFCQNCKTTYFTTILNQSEKNVTLFRATWEKYHCKSIIDETMKCIKCKSTLYINIITNKLICLNQRCNFTSNDKSIIWKCCICSKDFISHAKIYNPIEFIYYKKAIKLALLKKKNAKPKKLPCCRGNLNNLIFYHKEECKGELYLGKLNDNEIIVCNKCHAINFTKSFIWTCPLCGSKIKDNSLTLGKSHSKDKTEHFFNFKINNEIKAYKTRNLTNFYSSKKLKCITLNNTNDSIINTEKNISEPNTMRIRNRSYFKNIKTKTIKGKIIKIDLTENISNKTNYEEKYKYKNIDRFFSPIESRQNSKIIIIKNNTEISPRSTKKGIITYNNKNNINNDNKIKLSLKSHNILRLKTKTNENTNLRLNYLIKNEEEKNYEKKNNKIFGKNIIMKVNSYSKINEEKIKKKLELKTLNSNYVSLKNKNNIIIRSYSKEKEATILNNKLLKINKNYINEETININRNMNKKFLNISQESFNSKKDNKKNENKKIEDNYRDNNSNINKKNLSESSKSIMRSKFHNYRKYKHNNTPTVLKNIRNNKSEEISTHIMNKRNNIKIINYKNPIYINEKVNNLLKYCKIKKFDDSEIKYIKPIGKGSDGIIYLVQDIKTKKEYALKKIICHEFHKLLIHKKEFELLFSLNHENIMKIYKINIKCLDSTIFSFEVLMEKAKGDWIMEISHRIKNKKYYKEAEIINLLKQIVKALSFLQKNNIAHRDVKPQNILVFPKNIYKIADFGEYRNINNKSNQLTLKGSELYMSPILYEGHKYKQKKIIHNPYKSDVFSLGYCVLFAITLGVKLLDNIREIKDMNEIASIIIKCVNKKLYSNKLICLILNMINLNESQRFDFIELEKELKNF